MRNDPPQIIQYLAKFQFSRWIVLEKKLFCKRTKRWLKGKRCVSGHIFFWKLFSLQCTESCPWNITVIAKLTVLQTDGCSGSIGGIHRRGRSHSNSTAHMKSLLTGNNGLVKSIAVNYTHHTLKYCLKIHSGKKYLS